jgi:hypothetical protein
MDRGDSGSFRVIPDAVMDIVYFDGALRFAGADTRESFAASTPGAVSWGVRLPPGLAHGLLSERTLRRFSGRQFGYGVKTLASIHRLQRALRLGKAGATPAEAALGARYADQAHLSREAKRFTGLSFRALVGR